MRKIIAGTELRARSACSSNCVFTLEVISRTAAMATVKYLGRISKTKVHVRDGHEYLKPGRHAWAPIFKGTEQ